jgi:hypothetical protein
MLIIFASVRMLARSLRIKIIKSTLKNRPFASVLAAVSHEITINSDLFGHICDAHKIAALVIFPSPPTLFPFDNFQLIHLQITTSPRRRTTTTTMLLLQRSD